METGKNHIRSLYISNLGFLDNLGMTQILPYIKGLADRGIRFTALTFEKSDKPGYEKKCETMKGLLAERGIKWTWLAYHRRWGNLLDIFAGFFIACFLALRDRADILHVRSSIPVMIGWPVARLLGKKIIYDRRGTMKGDFVDDVNLTNIFSKGFFPNALDALDRFFLRHSDGVVVLSEKSRDLLKRNELSGKRTPCDYIPCCVEPERFAREAPGPFTAPASPGRPVLAYVGSVGTCYLLGHMIDFFKALREEAGGGFFLVISHSEPGAIKAKFAEKEVPPGNYAVVDASPDEVPAYLKTADLSVMFIKEVECKIGASPTKLAESLASGVPVVINSGIGDADEIIRENRAGCIVKDLSAEGCRKAAAASLELIKEGDALKKRCRELAGRFFSMKMGIDKYASLYAEALKNTKRRHAR